MSSGFNEGQHIGNDEHRKWPKKAGGAMQFIICLYARNKKTN